MSELNYVAVLDALVALLKNDARLAGVWVTDELDPPMDSSMPCIICKLTELDRAPYQLTAGYTTGAPDRLFLRASVECWDVSVESTKDARRKCAVVLRTCVDVLRESVNLGGLVKAVLPGRVEFKDAKSEGTIYAGGIISVGFLTLA